MVRYREMTTADLQAVFDMEKMLFSDAWSKKGLYDTMEHPCGHILLAEADGRVAGYAIVYLVADEGELMRIGVLPAFRRQKIGQGLLKQIALLGKEQDVCRIFLEVRDSNHTAQCFYKQCGFTTDGVRKKFYENPTEDAILMSITLPVLSTGQCRLPII